MHELGPVLLLVLGIGSARLVGARTGVPSPVLLVLGGLLVALLPVATSITLDPAVILVLVLPPLLYSAALDASLLDFRANARPIGLLSVGLVLVTALAVGTVAHLIVPGLPLSAAFALGAIVAPPDAVAAIAIGRRVGMPARLQTLIEGEGLLNDATALVTYQVAVAAVVGGGFSLLEATDRFALASVGGLATGAAVALLIRAVRRRLEEALVENALSLATPFLAYLPAEKIHASGVLAVVVCGLILGHASPTILSSTSRLQTGPVWRLVSFLLEGGVFVLIGLQLPEVVRGLGAYSASDLAGWAAVVVSLVLIVRPLWIFPATYLPRRFSLRVRARDPAPRWQQPAALSWAGMRGVVSLAAAFALPLHTGSGQPFPQRDLLLFLTFVVICVTLLLQGLTFARVLRVLGLRPDRQQSLLDQAAAQQAAIQAGLRRLEQVVAADSAPEGVADNLRRLAEQRVNAGWERLAEVRAPATGDANGRRSGETPSAAWRRLRAAMIEAERGELVRLRDTGELPDEALREMQSLLDYEEAALHPE